jgi:hypothetical protein
MLASDPVLKAIEAFDDAFAEDLATCLLAAEPLGREGEEAFEEIRRGLLSAIRDEQGLLGTAVAGE